VPVISHFFGIIVFMFWREYNPPHFHAKYADQEIVIEIESGRINGGTMANRALALLQEWRELNKEALLRDWKLAEQKKALFPIKPLE
jgi:hypothetical protein